MTPQIEPALLYCLDRPYVNSTFGGEYFLYFRLTADVILTVSTLTLNATLIAAIVLYRRCYRGSVKISNSSASMKFVLQLALSDILVGLSVPCYLFPHYLCDINDLYRRSELGCMMKFVPSCFASVMSNLSLIGIAVDRYIAVVHSIKYRMILTDGVCNLALVLTSLFAAGSSSVLLFWNYWEPGSYCDLEDVVPHIYVITLGSVCHGVILVVVAGIHYRLHQQASDANNEAMLNVKSAKVVGLVTGVYFLCWTPYSVALMIRVMQPSSPAFDFVFQMAFVLSYLNSSLNPFIYAWKNAEIRSALKWFFRQFRIHLSLSR